MKKLYCFLLLTISLFIGISLFSQNKIIEELKVLDSSNSAFRFSHQSLVYDAYNECHHFFYVSQTETHDYIIKRTSCDNGESWGIPDTISIHTPSITDIRYYADYPSATVDAYGNINVIYNYQGLPLYDQGYPGYPPSHINHVYYAIDHWVTDVDVVNDHDIQAGQGNPTTVCYLMNSQMADYNGKQFYIGYDYAWWATQYNIVISDNKSGQWEIASPLYTYNLGVKDIRILNAPSIIENGGLLYAIWYQKQDCFIEMKTYDNEQWSELEVIYNDTYFSAPNSYTVGVSNYSNSSRSIITMHRTPETDFNELLIMKKAVTQPWTIDTLMLNNTFSAVRPTISGDTTLLLLLWESGLNYSYLMKHIQGQGTLTKEKLITNKNEERFNNMTTSHNGSLNPIAYMVYSEIDDTYYLKMGKISGYTGIDDNLADKRSEIVLDNIYPNPAYNTTIFSYEVNNATKIELNLYTIHGKLISTIENEYKAPGKYTVSYDVSKLEAGIYFVELKTAKSSKSARLIVMS